MALLGQLHDLDPLRTSAQGDADTIWVSEVWESKEHRDASLQLPDAETAIGTAMSMVQATFTTQDLKVVGGLGV